MGDFLYILFMMALTGMVFYVLFHVSKPFVFKCFMAKKQYFFLKAHFIFYIIPIIYIIDNISVNYYQTTFSTVSVPKYSLSDSIENYIDFNIGYSLKNTTIHFIFGVWIVGVFVYYLYYFFAALKAHKHLRHIKVFDSLDLEVILGRCINEVGVRKDIQIFVYSDRCSTFTCKTDEMYCTPMSLGIMRPKIYIPESMCSLDIIDKIVCHELIHIKQNDLLWRMLYMIIHGLYWFVPTLSFVYKDLVLYSEMSCDEAVVEKLDVNERYEYGMALIQSIRTNKNPINTKLVTSFVQKNDNIKKRLLLIKKSRSCKHIRLRQSVVSFILIILSCGVFLFGSMVVKGSTIRYGFSWDRSGRINVSNDWKEVGMSPNSYSAYEEPHYILPGHTKIYCELSWFPITEDVQICLMLCKDINERYTVTVNASEVRGESSFVLTTNGVPEGEYYIFIKNPGVYSVYFDKIKFSWYS